MSGWFVVWNDEPTRKAMSSPDVFPRNVYSNYVPFSFHNYVVFPYFDETIN